MSTNREEIHWKFQILINLIDSTIQLHENERGGLLNYLEKYAHERKEIRNTLLGMMAFGIVLLVSLISIKIVEGSIAWLIIPSLIGAGAVYLITNMKVYSTALKIHNLNTKYLRIIEDLIKLKGFHSGIALKDEIPKDELLKIVEHYLLITQIFSYEIGHFAHNIIKSPKPNQELFRESYNKIKQNLEQIKGIGIEEQDIRFDLFLKQFEKNEKTKT